VLLVTGFSFQGGGDSSRMWPFGVRLQQCRRKQCGPARHGLPSTQDRYALSGAGPAVKGDGNG
jgi:hypothetical protein